MGEQAVQNVVATDEGAIAFEDVTVQTPSGTTLLEHLTFRVSAGESMVVCGHNGAGKSSIIRCLSSLWPITQGKITRPSESSSQNGDRFSNLYYLPQKPCNVMGSLSDQLTYPERLPGGLANKELIQWLRYVGLEYVMDREAEDNECDWETRLSLGEQQALSIARLLYHRPRFAILDECTSAVSRALESRLFVMARAVGTTCVTITHRPALEEHHCVLLRLTGTHSQDGRGWELKDLPHRSEIQPVLSPPGDTEDVHRRLNACLGESVKGSTCQDQLIDSSDGRTVGHSSVVHTRWPSSLRRLLAIFRLALEEPGVSRMIMRRVAVMSATAVVQPVLAAELWVTLVSAKSLALVGDIVGITSELILNLPLVLLASLAEMTFNYQFSAMLALHVCMIQFDLETE